jgi:hypothetical protein
MNQCWTTKVHADPHVLSWRPTLQTRGNRLENVENVLNWITVEYMNLYHKNTMCVYVSVCYTIHVCVVCVCVFTNVCVWMRAVCMCVSISVCVCVCVCACVYLCVYACVQYACSMCACAHAFMHAYMCVRARVFM